MGSTPLDTYLKRQSSRTKVPTPRDLFKSWLCHPKLSRSSCLLQSQAISSVLSECQATRCEIFLCVLLPSTLFSANLFPHSQFLSLFVGLAIFCFVFILFESSSQYGEVWASLFWACSSGMWSLSFDSQVRDSVMLFWTWLNDCSGLADLWLFLPMFDLSKQTVVM